MENTKTIRDYLLTLPGHVYLRVLQEYNTAKNTTPIDEVFDWLNDESMTLSGLFMFIGTQEGHEYWVQINLKYFGKRC